MSVQGGQPQCSSPGEVVFGIVILVLGVILLLDRTGLVALQLSWRLWPFAVLALALARLTDAGRGCHAPGIWLLAFGAWGLVSEFGLFGFDHRTSWPLLVIGAGLGVVWHSGEGRGGKRPGDQGLPS
jgi:hypothetical protein